MRYQLNEKKSINIPDKTIAIYMKNLELTEEQAIQTYLEDEGYIKNEQVEALTKKAKESGADKIVNRSTPTRTSSERPPKENPIKEKIIKDLHNFLKENTELQKIMVTNKLKSIDFYVNDKYFTLTLTEHRPKKIEK